MTRSITQPGSLPVVENTIKNRQFLWGFS